MTSEFKVEENLGNSVNTYSGITVLEANGAQELAGIIQSIKFPINVIQIVVQGAKFYAFVNASRPVKVRKVK